MLDAISSVIALQLDPAPLARAGGCYDDVKSALELQNGGCCNVRVCDFYLLLFVYGDHDVRSVFNWLDDWNGRVVQDQMSKSDFWQWICIRPWSFSRCSVFLEFIWRKWWWNVGIRWITLSWIVFSGGWKLCRGSRRTAICVPDQLQCGGSGGGVSWTGAGRGKLKGRDWQMSILLHTLFSSSNKQKSKYIFKHTDIKYYV